MHRKDQKFISQKPATTVVEKEKTCDGFVMFEAKGVAIAKAASVPLCNHTVTPVQIMAGGHRLLLCVGYSPWCLV
jgi:hypothetical protein